MAYLCYWKSGYTGDASYGKTKRLYQAGDIVNNNTDPDLYVSATIDDITYKFYNSAIYLNTSTNIFYPMFLTTNGSTDSHSHAVQMYWNGWSDGSYGSCTKSGSFYISPGGIRKRNGGIVSGDCIYYILNNEITDAIVPVFTDYNEYLDYICSPIILTVTSNGGGATHIAKVSGQLSTLSSNLSDILMVSGGGGGGMIIGTTVYAGADAGGISGNSINSANQSTGYAFGQGENGSDSSGGGSGLYGGYKGAGGGDS